MPFDAFTAIQGTNTSPWCSKWIAAIDGEHVSASNPTGVCTICKPRLRPPMRRRPERWRTIPDRHGVLQTCQQGDAPLFKSLADAFAMSDNYHQPVHGGTGPNSQALGFADQVFFSDGQGNPATPPAASIYNPDPQPGTLNLYTSVAAWFNCSDTTQRNRCDRALPAGTAVFNKKPLRCGRATGWR